MQAERLPINTTKSIPWLNMEAFLHGSPKERLEAAMRFGDSFRQLGFVAISNIGINKRTIDNADASIKEFFDRDEAYKTITQNPQGQVGYGSEHAKYTDVMDLKEFFQTTGPTHDSQYWPDLPGFKQHMLALYNEIEHCTHSLLRATAIYLGYNTPAEETILSKMLGTGNAVMRIIHYPPVDPQQIPPGAVRAAAHEDLCMITVIPRTSGPGLQVKTVDDEWLEVVVPDNSAVINAGDTLQIMTNGMIPSTTHRVVNPAEGDRTSRYSVPFFGNLIPTIPLTILDKCKLAPAKYPQYNKMNFSDFYRERMLELGLLKE